ncbi:MAG: hypothetical protein ACLU4J_17790 [Butyricimonas paravirosa]
MAAKSDYHGNRRFQGVLAGHAGSVKQLLEGKLSPADKDTKAHYRALILQIEKALKAE